jgi:tyrosinase
MDRRDCELFHRRDVLRGSLAAGLGLLAPWSMAARAQPVSARIRREVHDPQAAPMLELYKSAVRMMRALPSWDPTSWWFQANIHWLPFEDDPQGCYEAGCFSGLFTAAPDADQATRVRIEAARRLAAGEIPIAPTIGIGEDRIWAKCPHRQLDFLPWHRFYLHFFEQIVERIVGEPFALPYWNYLDPNLRHMPLPFRAQLEADGSENPLFYPDRNPLTRNPDDPSVPASEKPLIRNQDLQWSLAAQETFFELGDIFGLTRGFSTQLERAPHDPVHGRIGIVVVEQGQEIPLGMATPALAARDPIFWLHHANIDRLWEWWRTREVAPNQPPRDPLYIWSLEPYRFASPDGLAVGLPAAGALDLVGSAYDYDTLEPFPAAPEPELVASAERREPRLVGRSTGGVRVENAPADIELEAAPGLEASAAPSGAGERWFLRLSGIRSAGAPAGVLDVHLDLEDSPEVTGPPAASFAFFDVAPRDALAESVHARHDEEERVLDVTERVRALIEQGADPGALRITIRPAGNATPLEIGHIELFSR